MKSSEPKFISKNLGYMYSGYLCRGFKTWQVTAPSGNSYSIIVTVGRDGTNNIGYIHQGDEKIASVPCASYHKCLDLIKDRENLKPGMPDYEKLVQMFVDYVTNDAEGSGDPDYIISMLDMVGCDASTRKALGLDFPKEGGDE